MKWPTLFSFINLIILFSHLSIRSYSRPTPRFSPRAPAFYVLGDSLVDNGNNNWLVTAARANYRPYGINFVGGATGRFSNGKTVADFYADYVGVPYSPPYEVPFRLQIPFALTNASFYSPPSFTGYNYASAGSGILPETGYHFGKGFNLDEQISMLEHTINEQLAPAFGDAAKLSQYLAKSIFFISAGSNDYINNYHHPLYYLRKGYNPLQFANFITNLMSQKLQRLYNLGVRKVLITEIGPLGCAPTIARGFLLTNPIGKCDDVINRNAQIYNKQLTRVVQQLSSSLPDAHFMIEHCYDLNSDAIFNPRRYGLTNGFTSCCSTLLNGSYTCVAETTPCSDPDKHYFWDGYHPSEIAYSLTAKECIYGTSVCYPMNFRQLVEA